MKREQFDFSRAKFSYFVGEKEHPLFRCHRPIFDNLILSHSEHTEVRSFRINKFSIYIIGLCVDSHQELDREEIPEFLLEQSRGDLNFLIGLSSRLAGKFVILFGDKSGVYVLGDPTSSLPVHYYTGDQFYISSSDHLIAKWLGLKPSRVSLDIRKSSAFSQPLPYDITLYDEIKVLLPNHYLNCLTKKAFRFGPRPKMPQVGEISAINRLIEATIDIVDNIVREYVKTYDIICPLSSGYDSRVVFAFLRRHLPDLECYTFKHPNFTDKTGDYHILRVICEKVGVKHHSVPDIPAPAEYVAGIKRR